LTLPDFVFGNKSFVPRRAALCLVAALICGAAGLTGCGGGGPDEQEPAQNSSSRLNPLASMVRVSVGVRKSAATDPATSFDCWVAQNFSQRGEGLAFVTQPEMPDGDRKGMIFVYPRPSNVQFYGKDTFITLDVAFAHKISEGVGRVTSIGAITPYQRTLLSSKGGIDYILMTRQGDFDRTKIKVGDLLYIPVATPAN
jgi:uncharacterized membrane protein (UPF0127 family)